MALGELITITHSQVSAHLGTALDSLFECRAGYPVIENRRSASVIIHAFSGLESLVNLLGTQMFFDKDFAFYISEKNRDYALKRLIRKWKIMPVLEKIELVLSQVQGAYLPQYLKSQLGELNNLRNWIVHGFIYKETILIDDMADEPSVVDSEVHIDWVEKFPTTKFKLLSDLDRDDACLALRISLETIQIIGAAFHYPVVVFRMLPDGSISTVAIAEGGDDIDEIISSACAGKDVAVRKS